MTLLNYAKKYKGFGININFILDDKASHSS